MIWRDHPALSGTPPKEGNTNPLNEMMRNIAFFIIAVALVFQAGCGGGGHSRPSDLPKLHPVNITITQGGSPLAGAMVNLLSKTPATYGSASAVTDASGVAVPWTYGFAGVPEGQYTVTVSKSASDGNKKVYRYVDAKYSSTETSPFSIDVKAGRTGETFDVGAQVKELLTDDSQE